MKQFATLLACAGALAAQVPNPTQRFDANEQQTGSVPIFRVTVVSRTLKAVNYGHREMPTRIDFRGTVLQPDARGEAKVESRQGSVVIDAKFSHVGPPTKFGLEYLTYVLWAITPQGQPVNLGELVLNGSDKGHLLVSTHAQAFGMMVTAEPYFAVLQPSDVVIMENVLRPDTVGKVGEVEAKYELMPRGQYTLNVNPSTVPWNRTDLAAIPMNQYEAVLALYEARNAVQIAKWAGADRMAMDTYAKADALLQQAEGYYSRRVDSKLIVSTAREAAQTAQDARSIAVRRQQTAQAQP